MYRLMSGAALVSCLAIGASPTAVAQRDAAAARIEIPVSLQRIATGAPTVSFGLPLPPGVASDPSAIRVFIGKEPVAAQVTPLLRDHDPQGRASGLRAVRIQFPASLMTSPSLTVLVVIGEAGPAAGGPVVPFAAVSGESVEAVTVVDRTIVQEGGQYRLGNRTGAR